MTGDTELLEAWRGGDKQAGQELFSRHYPSVLRFYRNKIAEEHVADLVQQTFLACVEGSAGIHTPSHFRAYLFATARNLLYLHLRAKYRGGGLFDPTTATLEDLSPGPRSLVGRHREQRLLLEALRSLPVDTQMLLELRFWENMKTADIAEVMDMPHPTVRSRLHRAHERLQEALSRMAGSQRELESTLTRLDDWAAQVRELLGPT